MLQKPTTRVEGKTRFTQLVRTLREGGGGIVPFSQRLSVNLLSKNQHRVAVAEESVAMLDRDPVRLFDEFRSGER